MTFTNTSRRKTTWGQIVNYAHARAMCTRPIFRRGSEANQQSALPGVGIARNGLLALEKATNWALFLICEAA